jgi:hypothetical protein
MVQMYNLILNRKIKITFFFTKEILILCFNRLNRFTYTQKLTLHMKSFIFTNSQGTFHKEYKTDHIDGQSMFTVHDIKVWGDLTNDETVRFGLGFERLPYSIQEFKAFATTYNLTLIQVDNNAGTTTTLVAEGTALTFTTASLTAGTHSVKESTLVAMPATSAASQGDFIELFNLAGTSFVAWLDINAAGTIPSGPIFTAATYKIKVSIVTGGTAIQNAAILKAALIANAKWTGFNTITDNGNGTLTIQSNDFGSTTDAVVKNAAESGVGSITKTITQGTSHPYSLQLVVAGGVAPYNFELDSTSAALPEGIILSSYGLLSGRTASTGTPALVFKATDTAGATITSGSLTLTIS